MEKIKVGIIGCGGIAKSHANGYKENGIAVVALTDLNGEAAKAMSEELEGARIFDDFKQLIDSGTVDAASICTPPVAHEEAAVYALEKGVHVLLEKPQAHSVESAKKIVDAANRSDAKLMMAFRHRYLPAIQKMKSIIDEGKIGKVVFFQNIFCGPAFHMKDKWFTKKAVSGGGCILDTSSHSVDLFRYLVGEVVEQKAVMHTHFDGTDVEDAGIITVKAENGALGSMTSSFVAGDGMAFVDITGQDGRVVYDYLKSSELKYKKRGETEWEIMEVQPSGGFAEQIALFAKAIMNNEDVPCKAIDGLRDVEIIQANY